MISLPKLIVTRPLDEANAFAALAARAGFEPVISPTLEIHAEASKPDLAGAGALAVTSQNAVRQIDGEAFSGPVFAVGEATAAAARAAGFADVRTAGGDGASLVRTIIAARGAFTGEVLHVSGAHLAFDIGAALRKAGVPARRMIAYRAKPKSALVPAARAALAERRGDLWAALFSPRSAQVFLRQVDEAGAADDLAFAGAACLSAAVLTKAHAPWREVVVADAPTSAALLAAIRRGAVTP